MQCSLCPHSAFEIGKEGDGLLKLSEKEKIVEDLHEKFSRARTALLTDFRGLNMSAMTELRSQLRGASVEYRVVKNTLMKRAADGTDMALLKEHFLGPCAVALSYKDPVAPAKILMKFSEDNSALEVRVGVVEGRVVDLAGIKRLSKLPSQGVLLAQLLSVMNAPVTGLVTVLSGVLRNFLGVVEAIKRQKEGAAQADR
jgi:large subunit ribosomal protein L10